MFNNRVSRKPGAIQIGTTTVARVGVDRFDGTEHSGLWEQSVHAGQEYLFVGFAAFTIELAIRENEVATHAEPHP